MNAEAFSHVEARQITKIFGRHRALHKVDLRLEAGTLTALLGPNGAGKTTLLSIFSTLSRPTQGEMRFGEIPPREFARARARIGLVSHAPLTYGDLSAVENLVFFARLHGTEASEARALHLLERFDLTDAAHRPAKTFSRGMRQRLGLARALVAEPSLLLLDEPFTGLDRASKARVTRQVANLRESGVMVLLISHDLGLTADLADTSVVLRRGRIAGTIHRCDSEALRTFYAEMAEGPDRKAS